MPSLIDWTSDKIRFLHACWISGVSTREIARQINERYDIDVANKNIVVGKVHRLAKESPMLWIKRQSPLLPPKHVAPKPLRPDLVEPQIPEMLPELPCLKVVPFVDHPPPAKPAVAPLKSSEPAPFRLVCEGRRRLPGVPLRRPDGSGCRRIMGEPKSAWRVCDAALYDLSKPYCRSCHDLCTIKSFRIADAV